MKKILLSGITGLFMLGMAQRVEAQSSNAPAASFSQYHYTPFTTNPAMIGSSNDLRFGINYRRQQLGAGQSFDTQMYSVIYPFFTDNREKRRGGVGVSFISDNAASFSKTNGGSATGAYNIHIGENSIAFGAQVGYFQTRIDAKGITTSSQYVGGGFDPLAPTNENISADRKGFVTFNAGAYWNREDEKDREKAFFGVSYMNINQPNLNFVGQSVNDLTSKVSGSLQLTGGVRVLHTDRFAIMPSGRFIMAAGKHQINAGSWFRYHLSESMTGLLRDGEFGLGLWYNNNNFVVAALEFNQPHYLLSVSYDIATRNDISVINSNGILEFTGAFKLNRHHHRKQPPSTDRDGDGIFDENDACPDVPGKKEFIGCPDTDNDGIPDDHDNCPQDPGLKEFAGCPDKDGDGIQDSKDQCPNDFGTKETFGCPDKDGDHVADKDDECPNEPGLAVDKGCPKKMPEYKPVQVTGNIESILKAAKYVHFETGTSKIEKVSNSFLDLVVDILINNYPDKSIMLEGHTDDVGEADKNMTLSINRAEAVKAYMVSKGVAAERILTSGKGETEPLHPNDSDENREVNRRVEMKIVEKK